VLLLGLPLRGPGGPLVFATLDCKTGANVYTLGYFQVPSYETRYAAFVKVSESPCYAFL
jgi:hypothetical protein